MTRRLPRTAAHSAELAIGDAHRLSGEKSAEVFAFVHGILDYVLVRLVCITGAPHRACLLLRAPAEHLPAHPLLNQTLNPKSLLACHPKSLLACHPKSVLAHC